MRRIFSFSLVLAAVLPTSLNAEELLPAQYRMAVVAYRDCIHRAAEDYSVRSCLPPSEIVPAVFGSCRAEYQEFERQADQNLSVPDVKRRMLEGARTRLSEIATKILLDAQLARGCQR